MTLWLQLRIDWWEARYFDEMEQIQQTLARCRLWQRRRGGTHLRMEPQELGISRKVLQKVSSLVILLHASLHLQPVAKRQYMVSGTLAHQHCNGSFEVGRAAASNGTMFCRIKGNLMASIGQYQKYKKINTNLKPVCLYGLAWLAGRIVLIFGTCWRSDSFIRLIYKYNQMELFE